MLKKSMDFVYVKMGIPLIINIFLMEDNLEDVYLAIQIAKHASAFPFRSVKAAMMGLFSTLLIIHVLINAMKDIFGINGNHLVKHAILVVKHALIPLLMVVTAVNQDLE